MYVVVYLTQSIFPQRLILWPFDDLNSDLPPTALSNDLKPAQHKHNIIFQICSFSSTVEL